MALINTLNLSEIFFSAKVSDTGNTELIKISQVCNEYYKQIKDESVLLS